MKINNTKYFIYINKNNIKSILYIKIKIKFINNENYKSQNIYSFFIRFWHRVIWRIVEKIINWIFIPQILFRAPTEYDILNILLSFNLTVIMSDPRGIINNAKYLISVPYCFANTSSLSLVEFTVFTYQISTFVLHCSDWGGDLCMARRFLIVIC